MKKTLVVIVALLLALGAPVWAASPVGKWKTIDDETKKEKSIVEIYEVGGKYYGRIVQLLQEKDGGKSKLCTKCPGADANKPMLGLVFLKDLQADGNEFTGGTIMDPNNGKIYKCKMELIEGGSKLKVRGFLGVSLLGRTQIWQRVP
ncbi:MAG: DUF2147 domain-containing protein [Syntrophales bacterium]|nr:DUF2147 domain-containing protein [Syntrophales bacterium]